jgi:hypothetical protein
MVISSTLFPHKNIHKWTWRAPDGKTNNHINLVLINARHATDILGVRSYSRADCNYDHFLVHIKFKPKISVFGIRSGKKIKIYNITKLNQKHASLKYREEMNKLLLKKPVLPNTLKEEWQNIKVYRQQQKK